MQPILRSVLWPRHEFQSFPLSLLVRYAKALGGARLGNSNAWEFGGVNRLKTTSPKWAWTSDVSPTTRTKPGFSLGVQPPNKRVCVHQVSRTNGANHMHLLLSCEALLLRDGFWSNDLLLNTSLARALISSDKRSMYLKCDTPWILHFALKSKKQQQKNTKHSV